jgi:hypothetical protein
VKNHILILTSFEDINVYQHFKSTGDGSGGGIEVLPVKGRIADVRDYVINFSESRSYKKVLMLDDDLLFYRRKSPTDWHLRYLEAGENQLMVDRVSELLNEYAAVGISAREGNNYCEENLAETTRMMRAIAFDVSIIKGEQLSFKMPDIPVTVMDDFYMTLQLITLGYPNAVMFDWAQGQPGSDTPGGASTYRDLEMQKQNALKLQELFPKFVKAEEKLTTSSWGATPGNPITRTDVRIYWKKALGSRAHLSKMPSTDSTPPTETPGAAYP